MTVMIAGYSLKAFVRVGLLTASTAVFYVLCGTTSSRSEGPTGELKISPADVGLVGKETFYTFSALFEDVAMPCFETTGLLFTTQFGIRINIPIARMDYKVAIKNGDDNTSTEIKMFNDTCAYEIRVARKKRVGGIWIDDVARKSVAPK